MPRTVPLESSSEPSGVSIARIWSLPGGGTARRAGSPRLGPPGVARELRARAGRDLDAAGSTRPGSAEVPPSMLVRPAAPPIAESRMNQPAYAAMNTRRSAARPIATNRTHTVSPLLSAAIQPGRYRAGLGRPGYIPCRRPSQAALAHRRPASSRSVGVAVTPGRQDVRAGRSERSGRFRAPGRGAREAGLLAGMGMPGLEPGTRRAHRLGRRA
jgi:hypothetical protein